MPRSFFPSDLMTPPRLFVPSAGWLCSGSWFCFANCCRVSSPLLRDRARILKEGRTERNTADVSCCRWKIERFSLTVLLSKSRDLFFTPVNISPSRWRKSDIPSRGGFSFFFFFFLWRPPFYALVATFPRRIASTRACWISTRVAATLFDGENRSVVRRPFNFHNFA